MAKVLIVDDDTATAHVLERLFRMDGHQPTVAASGTDAIASVRALRPDIILLDVMMPDIDGMEVLQRVRADPDPTTAAVPVIMYSAMSDPNTIARAKSHGASDYWIKASLTFNDILQRIARHLRASS
jgi:CheY-like chemotaxis protein